MDSPQDSNQKQQLIERIKSATNILVTVSSNPSVDQLSACIGLTLLLNKLEKHATAVFSGQVPSTLEFLQPEKTIEKTTDSLRDFIISLDRAKADKLRYKVEENVVKIFITPYRTSISDKDLDFSQGDFNVDAVLALGVSQREQLDQAITSHGRILHDATVITVSAGQAGSTLGTINWQDSSASSLCEMLVSISEAFQGSALDNQMATAFLTGIVAETDRFSNTKTNPKVMTMAAQLMASGANQQLIASELTQLPPEPEKNPADMAANTEASADTKVADQDIPAKEDGTLSIDHNQDEKSDHDQHEPLPSNQDSSIVSVDQQTNVADESILLPPVVVPPIVDIPAAITPVVQPVPAYAPPAAQQINPQPEAQLDPMYQPPAIVISPTSTSIEPQEAPQLEPIKSPTLLDDISNALPTPTIMADNRHRHILHPENEPEEAEGSTDLSSFMGDSTSGFDKDLLTAPSSMTATPDNLEPEHAAATDVFGGLTPPTIPLMSHGDIHTDNDKPTAAPAASSQQVTTLAATPSVPMYLPPPAPTPVQLPAPTLTSAASPFPSPTLSPMTPPLPTFTSNLSPPPVQNPDQDLQPLPPPPPAGLPDLESLRQQIDTMQFDESHPAPVTALNALPLPSSPHGPTEDEGFLLPPGASIDTPQATPTYQLEQVPLPEPITSSDDSPAFALSLPTAASTGAEFIDASDSPPPPVPPPLTGV